MARNLALLGSTGSIGTQTLDVVQRFPDRIRVVALAGGRNLDLLRQQIAEFRPRQAGATLDITQRPATVEWCPGEQGMVSMATHPDVDLVVVATTGRAGLAPTLAALDAGKVVALANKEVLVAAGIVVRDRLLNGHGRLIPIDSEHSAIWQCLQGEPNRAIERLTLTASGGALRGLAPEDLAAVTPEQALRHPTWRMGPKITIDSATLMNKGLEVLEAAWLFDVPLDHIEVVLHPRSIAHALVTFRDGSIKAELGTPDMRGPIQYALSHPERWPNDLPRLDLSGPVSLDFEPIDLSRYPALTLALKAGAAGGTYPAALCAADEVAVDAFLRGVIRFTDIAPVVQGALDRVEPCGSPNLEDILGADSRARRDALALVAQE